MKVLFRVEAIGAISSLWPDMTKREGVFDKRSPIRLRRIANKLRAEYLQKLGS